MSFKELMNVIFAIILYMQVLNNCRNWLVKPANISFTVPVFRNGSIQAISQNVHYVKANSCDLLLIYFNYLFITQYLLSFYYYYYFYIFKIMY
jgi:hypothetical protein